jgi:hypothetical protein
MLQIELKEQKITKVKIGTPYYAKDDLGAYYKFIDSGLVVIMNNGIYYLTTDLADYYQNATKCTREEVESKFKEVINNLKNKI